MLVNTIKSIFGGVGKVLSTPSKVVKKVVKGGTGEVLGAAANVAVPVSAIGTYSQYKQNAANAELTNAIKNLEMGNHTHQYH